MGFGVGQMDQFIQVFGQRFVGLFDSIGVYMTYRVPIPEAPYPQDYIIDRDGIVRYWADEYDPQEVIAVIDNLLGIGETCGDTNGDRIYDERDLVYLIDRIFHFEPSPREGGRKALR